MKVGFLVITPGTKATEYQKTQSSRPNVRELIVLEDRYSEDDQRFILLVVDGEVMLVLGFAQSHDDMFMYGQDQVIRGSKKEFHGGGFWRITKADPLTVELSGRSTIFGPYERQLIKPTEVEEAMGCKVELR